MIANSRRTATKRVLAGLTVIGIVAAIARFANGLGATTALTDSTPWGLWVGFDLLGGVALAAGGFALAGTVYVFGRERYRPLLRPAILTALLGYMTVIAGLLCDLGLPWHIWKPLFNWQPHSPLFEVAMCVMLYTTVLILEFSPVLLEHRWFRHPAFSWLSHWLKRLTLPLVIIGIVLSTLHQSSLGSLFLIMPFRVHPLWYSPILPVLFFASAIALGLAVVTLESTATSWLFSHPVRLDLTASLGRACSYALWIYLLLRLGDLAVRGVLPAALDGSWQSVLFIGELTLGVALPALLLSRRGVRANARALASAAGLVVAGVLLNRLSISLLTIARTAGTRYFPSTLEIAISVGILAAAGLAFIVLTENLRMLDGTGKVTPESRSRYARPVADRRSGTFLGRSTRESTARWSMGLIIVAAGTIALLPRQAITGPSAPSVPVKSALGWESLWINGDRDADGVAFDHLAHWDHLQEIIPAEEVCATCHHLDMPGDQASACSDCHRDMYKSTKVFDHEVHQTSLGGNSSCVECHLGAHLASSAKPCVECHSQMIAEAASAPETRLSSAEQFLAPGYRDAIHGACMKCHRDVGEERGEPDLGLCSTCHQQDGGEEKTAAPGSTERNVTLERTTPRVEASGASGEIGG